ncbi:uncharacterized protein NPIL_284661 [Nephila pilipes]|uniref:Uncharacterized protein n=1 Tax=Nephila pilipes TaxID=299642 RepID=A0A8X6MS26_NEPPI|nr:uncharacterized protein NPIL_284661 [Nephila pilipes]
MESFRSEENHQFTKDAFLITLFDMRNQSVRAVSSPHNNKGTKGGKKRTSQSAIAMAGGKKECQERIWMSRRLFSLFSSSNTSLWLPEAKRNSRGTQNLKISCSFSFLRLTSKKFISRR